MNLALFGSIELDIGTTHVRICFCKVELVLPPVES